MANMDGEYGWRIWCATCVLVFFGYILATIFAMLSLRETFGVVTVNTALVFE
jgi:hypothetical protein